MNDLLQDFKSGKKDRELFWINLNEKFILIEYYAVRDQQKNYLGVIEISRDITSIKNLQGEKRLLTD